MKLTIATRKSPLAMAQTHWVAAQLQQHYPDADIELLPLSTRGDEVLDKSLAEIGGKALFLKELEMAMLDGRADMAVHSLKDMPADLPEGLCLAGVCERVDPRDVFVSAKANCLADLPAGSVIGTASPRRQSQLLHAYPALRVQTIRGNVQTRLDKLYAGEVDGLLLAAAGLLRLDLMAEIKDYLSVEDFLPAIGQGVLAIECRSEDVSLQQQLQPLIHGPTWVTVQAERALSARLQASCHSPLAAYATLSEDTLTLTAMVGSLDGKQHITQTLQGDVNVPVELGEQMAEALLAQGAAPLLKQTG
ncbi:MAG: porphobilinogen deaminase [marine bacterium B5-7]|nr:MAG: porphobilinogen deaminase [marine bacterium B5-7]